MAVGSTLHRIIDEKNAEIARLRSELAEARSALGTAKHQRDEWMRFCDKTERELAEARESASKYHAELVDSLRVVADERDAARQERDAAIRERDEARSRVISEIKKSLPHALENAKAVYGYMVDEGRARAMATLIVDEALMTIRMSDTIAALRAHAADVSSHSAPAQDGGE